MSLYYVILPHLIVYIGEERALVFIHYYCTCNVPIFEILCSAVGDDFMGLCQPDQKGNLMLLVSSGGLEELYDAFIGPFIIFHHQDHSCAVRFRLCCISTVLVIWE
jgi:hypothetical protein